MSEDSQYPEWYYANPIPGKDIALVDDFSIEFVSKDRLQHMNQVQMVLRSHNARRIFLGLM